jgi:hypothetical protein
MRTQPTGLVAIFGVVALIGCAKVNYLPRSTSTTYQPTTDVEILWTSPTRPFTELGLITVESDSLSEESMLTKLRQRAMKAGAHAVIMAGPGEKAPGAIAVPIAGGGFVMAPIDRRRMQGLAIRYSDPGNAPR